MLGRATDDARILEDASKAIWMLVAHHWRQSCSTHRAKAHLKECPHCAAHLGPFPMIFLWEEFRHSIAKRHPGHTNWEDQCTEQVTDGFRLASAAQKTRPKLKRKSQPTKKSLGDSVAQKKAGGSRSKEDGKEDMMVTTDE